MNKNRNTHERTQASCAEKVGKRRIGYEQRAAELKRELMKQREAMSSAICRPATASSVLDVPSASGPQRFKMAKKKYYAGDQRILVRRKSASDIEVAKKTKGFVCQDKLGQPNASSTLINRSKMPLSEPKKYKMVTPKASAKGERPRTVSPKKLMSRDTHEIFSRPKSATMARPAYSQESCNEPRSPKAFPRIPSPIQELSEPPQSTRKMAHKSLERKNKNVSPAIPSTSTGLYGEYLGIYRVHSASSDEYDSPVQPKPTVHPKRVKTVKNVYGKTVYQPATTDSPPDEECSSQGKNGVDYPDVERILESANPQEKLPIPDKYLPTHEDYQSPSAAFAKLEQFFKFIDNVEQQIGEHALKHDYSYASVLNASKHSTPRADPPAKDRIKEGEPDVVQSLENIDPRFGVVNAPPSIQETLSKAAEKPQPVKRRPHAPNPPEAGKSLPRTSSKVVDKKGRVCKDADKAKGARKSEPKEVALLKEAGMSKRSLSPTRNPIIDAAQGLIDKMLPRSILPDVRYTMLYTCLEWTLSQESSQSDVPLEEKMINAILYWSPFVEPIPGITPQTIIIKPGEIDPESVTVINVQTQTETHPGATSPLIYKPPSPKPAFQLDPRYAEHSIHSPELSPRQVSPIAKDVRPPMPELESYKMPLTPNTSSKPKITQRRKKVVKSPKIEPEPDLESSTTDSSDSLEFSPEPKFEVSLTEEEYNWLRGVEESDDIQLNIEDFEEPDEEVMSFLIPETRVVNAVPNVQNPRVAELDMDNVKIIRHPERYMEPLNRAPLAA